MTPDYLYKLLCIFARPDQIDRELPGVNYDKGGVHFRIPSDGYENSKSWYARWNTRTMQEAYERALNQDLILENHDRWFCYEYERIQVPFNMADMIDILRITRDGIERIEQIAKECRGIISSVHPFSSNEIDWERDKKDYVPYLCNFASTSISHDGRQRLISKDTRVMTTDQSSCILKCCKEIYNMNCTLNHIRPDGSIVLTFGDRKFTVK